MVLLVVSGWNWDGMGDVRHRARYGAKIPSQMEVAPQRTQKLVFIYK